MRIFVTILVFWLGMLLGYSAVPQPGREAIENQCVLLFSKAVASGNLQCTCVPKQIKHKRR